MTLKLAVFGIAMLLGLCLWRVGVIGERVAIIEDKRLESIEMRLPPVDQRTLVLDWGMFESVCKAGGLKINLPRYVIEGENYLIEIKDKNDKFITSFLVRDFDSAIDTIKNRKHWAGLDK